MGQMAAHENGLLMCFMCRSERGAIVIGFWDLFLWESLPGGVGVVESLKRAHKWLLVKIQPDCSADPRVLEIPWDDCQRTATAVE